MASGVSDSFTAVLAIQPIISIGKRLCTSLIIAHQTERGGNITLNEKLPIEIIGWMARTAVKLSLTLFEHHH